MVKQRILLVEDEGIVSIDIRNILNQMGYDVPAVAFTGEEAIIKAQEVQPDLVLMDIGLKGSMDGVETAKIIIKNHKTPIIFLTGFADNNTLQRAKMVKPAGYIIKPISENELKRSIEIALDK